MTDEWTTKRLGELCEVAAGPSGTYQSELADDIIGIPVLSPPEITPGNTIDARTIRSLPPRHAEELARFRLQTGDIVCVRHGSLGRFALIEPRHAGWLYGSACIRIRIRRDDLVRPAYLMGYLTHPPVRDWLVARAHPGTVSSIRKSTVADLPVALPSLRRQVSVSGLLGAVDDQIDAFEESVRKLTTSRSAMMADFLGGNLPVNSGDGVVLGAGARRPANARRGGRMS